MFFICMFAVAMVACKGKSNDDFKNVSADEFEGFIGNEQIQIADVRTVAEYSEGHIPGSKNVPLRSLYEGTPAAQLQTPVFVLLPSGARSRQSSYLTQKNGVYECKKYRRHRFLYRKGGKIK